MKIAMSFAVAIGVLTALTNAARACEPDDYICQKFKRIQAEKNQARRDRSTASRAVRRSRRGVQEASPTPPRQLPTAAPQNNDAVKTSMVRDIVPKVPVAQIVPLDPGAAIEPPSDLAGLLFATSDLLEVTTAQCEATSPHAQRRVSCSIAVHRTKLNNGDGEGCSGTLALNRLDFIRSGNGEWTNEDSISLCGGRLLRRSVLFPIALNGTPAYGMSEEYEFVGGDKTCAAPYLASRRPLQKSYLPMHRGSQKGLSCGTITAAP